MLSFLYSFQPISSHSWGIIKLSEVIREYFLNTFFLFQLAEKYPNCYIDLDLYSLETPDVKFQQNLAVLEGKIVMFAYVRDPYNKNSTGIAKLDGVIWYIVQFMNLTFSLSW